MIARLSCIAVVLLALGAVAKAGPLEAEIGAAAVVFDMPHAERETIGVGTLTATLRVDPRVPIGVRMHLAIGRGGAGTRVFGIAVRQQRGGLVIDSGFGIASITGNDMAPSLRPSGIGLALDVRVGYLVGPVTIAAYALPTWVFASDAFASEGELRSAIEAGLSIGRRL